MQSEQLIKNQLQYLTEFCNNEPSDFFYRKQLGSSSVKAAIESAEQRKDAAQKGDASPKTIVDSAAMFALYRDLVCRHASRKTLWKKGVDQKMFNLMMVQTKNSTLGDK